MNKEFKNQTIGGLFTPDSKWISPNTGSLRVSGWVDGNLNDPILQINIGKRSIEQRINNIALHEDSKNNPGIRLFETQIKIGRGLKKITFSISENDTQHKFCNKFVFQKNRITEIPAKKDIPEVQLSDYQKWLADDQKHLRKRSTEKHPDQETNSIIWVIELTEQKQSEILKSLASIFNQSNQKNTIYLIDRSPASESTNKSFKKELYTAIPTVSFCHFNQLTERVKKENNDWISFIKEGETIDQALNDDLNQFVIENPDVKLVYTDFDETLKNETTPVIQSDWNRDLLTSFPYISNAFLIDRKKFIENQGFGNARHYSKWELLLQVCSKLKRNEIKRICGIYFHLLKSIIPESPERDNEAIQILQNHLRNINEDGEVTKNTKTSVSSWRIQYNIPRIEQEYPKVSLLIPTRDGVEVLQTCVDSILQKTSYPNFEILILDNDSQKEETLEYFKKIKDKGCKIIHCPGKFNYSKINNDGCKHAEGSIVGFLNNDLEVIDEKWLHELVSHTTRPKIGAVGPKLLYPDGRLQHAGVLLGVGHVAAHAFRLFPNDPSKDPIRAHVTQNYSAVTAACLLVQKSIFEEVGGFDEKDLSITNNDVDLCIKIREAGYRNIYTPFATLFHHESATRGPEDTPEKRARYEKEVAHMWKKWPNILMNDPAYNRLLTRFKEDFSIANKSEIENYIPGKIF